jgi:hypothetical protein
MPKLNKIQTEKPDQGKDEVVDLESFIQKKKIQNNALKKIIEKINSTEVKK